MHAITTKLITFINFDCERVSIPKGEQIYVDLKEGIAFYNDMLFDIDKSEYQLIFNVRNTEH